jgi:hypothetical protein
LTLLKDIRVEILGLSADDVVERLSVDAKVSGGEFSEIVHSFSIFVAHGGLPQRGAHDCSTAKIEP